MSGELTFKHSRKTCEHFSKAEDVQGKNKPKHRKHFETSLSASINTTLIKLNTHICGKTKCFDAPEFYRLDRLQYYC